jgi:two-component system C4-dicarboxylate transport sensor histidine kinase DctB
VSDALRDARAAAWGAGAIVAAASLLMVVVLQRRRVISQKLAARAALQRAHDELEIKVQQRTAELVQAGKLALLGQLSAGISHELGQPLTALRALADNGRLLLERGRTEQVVENLRSIAGLSERMGRITAQLKAFVRKAPTTIGPVRLVDAVTDAQQLLATRLHAEQVELRVEVPPALHVLCDAYRLEQVLANLMVNAADAMRSSATKQLTIRAALTGERVVVSVVDSGPGIAPPLRERLFEPFFTTKPPGEGLGLGLVISAHIVEEFGGVLRAVDVPSGAVFEFDLAPAPQESHV